MFKFLHGADLTLPTSLFIRHGERMGAAPAQKDAACLLTLQGQADAYAFGRSINCPITRMISSPVERCVQTSALILEGQGRGGEVVQNPILRHAYIEDPAAAMEIFLKHKMIDIARMQLEDAFLPGFTSLQKGTARLLNQLRFDLSEQLNIFVTHDLLLATFYFSLTGLPTDNLDAEWFGYLDGFYLQPATSGGMRLYRGDRIFEIVNF